MKIYVVLSRSNDECSICNRAFYEYEKAFQYLKEKEEETGCDFYCIVMELEGSVDQRQR